MQRHFNDVTDVWTNWQPTPGSPRGGRRLRGVLHQSGGARVPLAFQGVGRRWRQRGDGRLEQVGAEVMRWQHVAADAGGGSGLRK